MGLGAAVHPGQGAEDGVDDEVCPAGSQEEQRGKRHTDGHPERREVIVVCRLQAVEGADLLHDALHIL